MSFRILLVDPDSAATAVTERTLVRAGHRVAPVSTFEEATTQMSLDHPDLLVTAVRLGAFNGLHLLLRCRVDHPDVPVIVIGALADCTADMTRFGAQFVPTPVDQAALLALVTAALVGRTPSDPNSARRWPRKRAALPATVSNTAARVVELSYGGLRLEMTAEPDDVRVPFDVRLPSLGMSVTAIPRWSKPAEDIGAWWCGAEIALASSDATRTWRWIVDSLN